MAVSETNYVLVTGAAGQIGSELIPALQEHYGLEKVVSVCRKTDPTEKIKRGKYHMNVDVSDINTLRPIFEMYKFDRVYHLAALLSGTGEQNPMLCWKVNMDGTINVLELCREFNVPRVLIPSSIAAFGPDCPKAAPQDTPLHPTTMYGVTKVAGEVLAEYYGQKFGISVRGLRLPGIISTETLPGGGTTDYAVEIFYEAIKNNTYTCFLSEHTSLPMMHMPDCIQAHIKLMEADEERLLRHSDFNVNGFTCTPSILAEAIKKKLPDFTIDYSPDFRQAIADSWPDSLQDQAAKDQWDWNPTFGLDEMVDDMLKVLTPRLKSN